MLQSHKKKVLCRMLNIISINNFCQLFCVYKTIDVANTRIFFKSLKTFSGLLVSFSSVCGVKQSEKSAGILHRFLPGVDSHFRFFFFLPFGHPRRSDEFACTTLRFCFSCSLTRRANRTRRGYRWPTSEPISCSSKKLHSTPHSVGRHEIHYHHLHRHHHHLQKKTNNTTTKTTTISTILHSTVYSIVCSLAISVFSYTRCYFILYFFLLAREAPSELGDN